MGLSAVSAGEFGADRWDELVDRFDEAWLWHRRAFRESIDFRVPQTDLSFVVLDEAQQPVAIMPLKLSGYAAFRVVRVNSLRSVGGPATANDLGTKQRTKVLGLVHEHLLTLAKRFNVVDVEVSAPPMAPALRGERCPRTSPLAWIGCSDAQAQTWVVDLRRPEEEIRRAYADHTRKALRKMQGEEYEIREASGESDLDTYYQMHCETFRRGGVRPHPRAFYELKFSSFVANGLARALFLVKGGEVVNGNITALYKGAAAYYGGVSRDGTSGGGNRLLMDEQIMWARRSGAEFLETGQAFLRGGKAKYKAISDFKQSFGAVLHPLFQGSIIIRPRTHAALQLVEALRRPE